MTRSFVLAALGAVLGATPALAVGFQFAGSGAADYRAYVGQQSKQLSTPLGANSIGISSLTLEVANKVVVDVAKGVNINVKMCFGCHGLELDQGYAEIQANDYFNVRLGRINVPVGEFNVRHDPANFTTPSKPLPYVMGDMLFYGQEQFNLGVIPTPYSDNGVEVFGSAWLFRKVQLDYSVYAVKGLVGTNDIDFKQTRAYPDNNATPAVGARAVASVGPFALGGSVGGGYYDKDQQLRYALYGADFYGKWNRFVLRAEAIVRRTDWDPTQEYLYERREGYFLKVGYYGQLDFELNPEWTFVYRFDGLSRRGMPLPSSPLTDRADITRHTAAVAVRLGGNVLLKGGYENWRFSGVPYENQHAGRLVLVYSY
ncbi:MAG: hypothetical protein ACOZIN_05705 [Myxococcota bacterium]